MMGFEMKLKPMKDDSADFSKCYIEEWENRKAVYCKQHGAMLCVKSDSKEAVYRCPQAINMETGKVQYPCYAGCVVEFIKNKENLK